MASNSTTIDQSTVERLKYVPYTSESQMKWVTSLIDQDLSEPYTVYTYRFFVNNWPELCILVSVDV